MSPRWTLSSTPLRSCRTSTGGAFRRGFGRGSPTPHPIGRARSGRARREGTPADATMPIDAHPDAAADAARLAASGGPPQARDPARREDRAEEVPRGRPRAVVAARLRGARRRAGAEPQGHDPDRDDGRPRARRAHRPRADPARRPGHGRRDARADAHRPGLAPRPVPRRAHASTGRVLQQAARLGERRPVPDPRPDARDRRLGHRRDRGAQALGRGQPGADQAAQPDRRAGGRARRRRGAPGRRDPLRRARPPAQREGLHHARPRRRRRPPVRDRQVR